jgi:ribonuclease P protein component
VRDRDTFVRLRRTGRRVRRGPITVSFVPDAVPVAGAATPLSGSAQPPRVAYAVGRKVGNAVTRNRLRRRLRAAMAQWAGVLAPGAYLVGAAAPAADLSWDELGQALGEALAAAVPTPGLRAGGRADANAGARTEALPGRQGPRALAPR